MSKLQLLTVCLNLVKNKVYRKLLAKSHRDKKNIQSSPPIRKSLTNGSKSPFSESNTIKMHINHHRHPGHRHNPVKFRPRAERSFGCYISTVCVFFPRLPSRRSFFPPPDIFTRSLAELSSGKFLSESFLEGWKVSTRWTIEKKWKINCSGFPFSFDLRNWWNIWIVCRKKLKQQKALHSCLCGDTVEPGAGWIHFAEWYFMTQIENEKS